MAEETEQDEPKESEDNTVYVGSKPAMSYAMAVVTQLNNGNDTVHIKARGKAISRAVDVAEIVRNRFVEDSALGDIAIGTDEIDTDDGDTINVSSIHIQIQK
ncbi:MAG: DNA-binding protein Alba [Candidatus Nanohaloarchaea archaeon]|nr:DNA-binding protein Alba [Candidatus Nanohaloarchaea archaeon]